MLTFFCCSWEFLNETGNDDDSSVFLTLPSKKQKEDQQENPENPYDNLPKDSRQGPML